MQDFSQSVCQSKTIKGPHFLLNVVRVPLPLVLPFCPVDPLSFFSESSFVVVSWLPPTQTRTTHQTRAEFTRRPMFRSFELTRRCSWYGVFEKDSARLVAHFTPQGDQ